MKKVQAMNANQLSEYLLTMKTGDEIAFGVGLSYERDDGEIEPDDVESWYFAKVLSLKEYGSRFIIIDYCGGEEAYAIPLNNYRDDCDDDDRALVPGRVAEYFSKHNQWLNSPTDIVYVEVND